MSSRTDHRFPALARHIIATAKQFVDGSDLERDMMESSLTRSGIKEEQVVVMMSCRTAGKIPPPRIGVRQFEAKAVNIKLLVRLYIVRYVYDM